MEFPPDKRIMLEKVFSAGSANLTMCKESTPKSALRQLKEIKPTVDSQEYTD